MVFQSPNSAFYAVFMRRKSESGQTAGILAANCSRDTGGGPSATGRRRIAEIRN